MDRARSRGRHFIAPGIVLACVLLVWRHYALALDPGLDVSQYAHTSWKIREGFTKGYITSIAQTPDGYLWLGTEFGLLRFDGVRNVPWQPPADQHLPSNYISKLLVARDGTLWIGTRKGLASWKDSKLTLYPQLSGQNIGALLEDHEGSVWAGTWMFPPPGKLCAIHNGSVRCSTEDASLGNGVLSLYEDSKGTLWAGGLNGLWQWKPGPPAFHPLPNTPKEVQGFAESDEGVLLLSTRSGIRRFVDGKSDVYPLPGPVRQFQARRLLRDRDGGLWIGTLDRGLVHVHQGRTDVFAQFDNLSGDNIFALFEDREGSIWVATENGLDRFRLFAVATFSAKQGFSIIPGGAVLAARDGSIWVATVEGLNRWKNGQISVYGKRSAQGSRSVPGMGALGTVREITGSGLPTRGVGCLFEDARGRIWVITSGGFGYMENDRYVSVSAMTGGVAGSIAEDTKGNLWVAHQDHGLFHLLGANVAQQISWASLGHKDPAMALAADPLQGGLWLGFFQGGVAYFKDGQIRASYAAADGLGEGHVSGFQLDGDGTLWAATEGGLSRLKNGRVATLTSKNGLPCDAVHWVMEDDAHSFWLYTACGLARIARPELEAWAAAADQDKDTKRTIQVTVFDSSDGVRSNAEVSGIKPLVAKSPDGKLWFLPWDGVSVVDPRHLRTNQLPPPLHIEQIIADRKTYWQNSAGEASSHVPLPPLVRDLEIDYTALSLVAPEKVRFRYKLEGWDQDWQDVGDRRKAFYSNLPPATYRFRVMACNNSGVWNEAGTFLDFSIAPAYYQTTWFLALCVAASLALLGALYQLRLRQVARQFNLRLEGRVSERTRIARDFHDTLLQSFQGVLLKFHAVMYLLPHRADEARQKLESVIDQAEQAIIEGRDAVQGLRSSTVVTNDLAPVLITLGEELAADQSGQNCPDFRVIVEGTPRNLVPLVRDEVYRIASEAVRNAFRHAQAERIEVEILYDRRQLRLWVRDNGKGIDPKVLAEGGREGHYGLAGMQERARLVGGKLAVWSKLDSGTETELTIPAAVAYAKSPAARRSLFSRKGK